MRPSMLGLSLATVRDPMPFLESSSIEPLLQAAAVVRDTLVVKPPAFGRTIMDYVMALCTALIAISLTILAAVAVPLTLRLRDTYRRVNSLVRRVQDELNPMVTRMRAITDDVQYITTSVRADMQLVNSAIAGANERIQDAVAVTEQRLGEFNALLEVVQGEAEAAFVATASTVRGVRTGAATFRGKGRARGTDLASDLFDPADVVDVAEDLDRSMDSLEARDGDNSDSLGESSAAAFSAAPRIGPRTRGSRRHRGVDE